MEFDLIPMPREIKHEKVTFEAVLSIIEDAHYRPLSCSPFEELLDLIKEHEVTETEIKYLLWSIRKGYKKFIKIKPKTLERVHEDDIEYLCDQLEILCKGISFFTLFDNFEDGMRIAKFIQYAICMRKRINVLLLANL